MKMENMADKINIIAPLLRGLLAKDGICPIVSFVEAGACKCKCTKATISDYDTAKVLDVLSDAVKGGTPECVEVDGVGCFNVKYPAVDAVKRSCGKVAIVTGAAQGFGLEIAQDLVSQGAIVVLADLNIEAAEKEAKALQGEFGDDCSLAIKMNVTDLGSIQDAISTVVKKFGGFDVFVSNAGVLKAESVKTQPEKDFDFVTAVNYKGYFLVTQVVSQILSLQHKANPAVMTDIIQINSKSGLVGSNRNGAYAGGKFGGIGLTQSFALELIEDGIKVNSICPGNFFDGPLWSEPENGLFAQYLRTGKVPGAKTIQDVKEFYEAKVPMKRGCTTADVMKAVYYLMEQKYETGQAVPVTGGQVMLH